MNGQYLSMRSAAELEPEVRRELGVMGIDPGARDIKPVIEAVKARSNLIPDIAKQAAVRLDPALAVVDEKGEALRKKLGAAFSENLKLAVGVLEGLGAGDWVAEKLTDPLKAAAEAKGLKLGDLMQ